MRICLFIVAALILSTSVALGNSENLKIFWWNLKGFHEKATIHGALNDIASEYDLILLGESNKEEIEKFQNSDDGKDFRYVEQIPYPNSDNIYISILSKNPIKIIHNETLDWGSSIQKDAWLKEFKEAPYNAFRSLIVFEVTKGQQKYLISPTHLLNPWRLMKDSLNPFDTAISVYFGKENPLYYQTQAALKRFSELNLLNSETPFIWIGDFNSPSNPLIGATINLILNYLNNLMLDNSATFDSNGLKIDHAFGNYAVKTHHDKVVQFNGSDHFPIEIEVGPQTNSLSSSINQ